MTPKPPEAQVRFVIDRITLHGLSPAQRARFLTSLNLQLTQLARSGELHPGASPGHVTKRVTAALRTAAGRAR